MRTGIRETRKKCGVRIGKRWVVSLWSGRHAQNRFRLKIALFPLWTGDNRVVALTYIGEKRCTWYLEATKLDAVTCQSVLLRPGELWVSTTVRFTG